MNLPLMDITRDLEHLMYHVTTDGKKDVTSWDEIYTTNQLRHGLSRAQIDTRNLAAGHRR